MGRLYSTHKIRNPKLWLRNLLDGKIALKWTLQKQGVMKRSGFTWLSTGYTGALWCSFRFRESKRWVSTGVPGRTVLCGVHSGSIFSVGSVNARPSFNVWWHWNFLTTPSKRSTECQQFSLLLVKSDVNTWQSWCQKLSPAVFCGVYHNNLHNSSYHMLVSFIFILIYHVYVTFLHSIHFSFICRCVLHIFFALSKISLHTRKISPTFTRHLSSF
jgi:hypothetical protein